MDALVHEHPEDQRMVLRRNLCRLLLNHQTPLGCGYVVLGDGQCPLLLQAHVLVQERDHSVEDLGQSFRGFRGSTAAPDPCGHIYFGNRRFEACVVAFHQVDDRSYFLGTAVQQLWPQMNVFGVVVVVVQDGIRELDMISNDLRAFSIAGRDTPNQCRHQSEFPPKHCVHRVHLASIGVGPVNTRRRKRHHAVSLAGDPCPTREAHENASSPTSTASISRHPTRNVCSAGRPIESTHSLDSRHATRGRHEEVHTRIAMDRSSPAYNVTNGITLRQLEYFIAVGEAEHFGRASERLLITQRSLSRQVRELEEALGVDLFVRDPRGVRLTEAGRELLAPAQRMFVGLECTIDAVRSAGRRERSRLRLGFYGPWFYNNSATRSALERFRAEAPDVEMTLHELLAEQMVPGLRDGRIDVAVGREVRLPPEIESRLITTEGLAVLLADDDELASKPAVALADLGGRGMIALQQDLTTWFRHVVEVAREANVSLSIVPEVTTLASLAYHVSRNEGIAIVPAFASAIPCPRCREPRDQRSGCDRYHPGADGALRKVFRRAALPGIARQRPVDSQFTDLSAVRAYHHRKPRCVDRSLNAFPFREKEVAT